MKITRKEQIILEKARILTRIIQIEKQKRMIDVLLRKQEKAMGFGL